MKVIITGATGMVGEGVMLECLQNENVSEIYLISRKTCGYLHTKLKELLVHDYMDMGELPEELRYYDACFYCAGISSVGLSEEKYHYNTYNTTISFAKSLLVINRNLCFCYVSGRGTDTSEKSNVMWSKVKGRTENALLNTGFRKVLNFRPGALLPFEKQKNTKVIYKVTVNLIKLVMPSSILTLRELAKAMIYSVNTTFLTNKLEIVDIKLLAK